jgi:hypothetical protein
VLADAYERTGSMEVLKRAAMVLADAMDPEMAGPEEGKEGKGRDQMAEKREVREQKTRWCRRP